MQNFMFNISRIRSDFSMLKDSINGHPLVYLDSANTALMPISVLKKMDEYYLHYKANIHRSVYPISEEATVEYESAREKVQKFLHARSSKEIIFTRNATEAINLVVNTWGKKNLKKGDVVVLSIMEHHSNIVPWQILQKEKHFEIKFLSLDEEGRLNMEHYKKILSSGKVKIVSVTHQSNVLGTINPIKKMIAFAHEAGAITLIDGAQSTPHRKIDVQDLDADFFVFTGHKLYGPTGIGVLYGKEKLLEEMPPFLGGGDMIRTVSQKESTWNDLPHKFEAGTQHIAGAIGLGAAIDYVNQQDLNALQKYEEHLLKKSLGKMLSFPNLRLFGPKTVKLRGSALSFEIFGLHPHDIATLLGEKGICVRAGHHCAQPLMEYLQVSATTRISLAFYNTEEEIEFFFQELSNIQKKLNKKS